MSIYSLLTPTLLLAVTAFAAGPRPENHPPGGDFGTRGATTIIAGDSYSAGVLGTFFEKQFAGGGEKVARYGISSSFVYDWLEKNPNDKVVGPGRGVDWVSPGRSGNGHAPDNYPKLREILIGEGSPNVKKVVVILGTNGLCDAKTVSDGGALAAQVKQSAPSAQCFWVGPKLFHSECGGDLEKQKTFSKNLGAAVQASCTFINSTLLPIQVGQKPHSGDFADEWARAVAAKLK